MPPGVGSAHPRIGITTAVPLEVLFAARVEPVDLNNRFIAHSNPEALVEDAERSGFPRNVCTWIKGIYSVVRREGFKRVIGVVQGDCSNTHALMEILRSEGVETVEFAYPYSREPSEVRRELDRFLKAFGVSWHKAQKMQEKLREPRALLEELDRLTWEEGRVRGEENFQWCLSSSDMLGDPVLFAEKLKAFLQEARMRPAEPEGIPIGLVGIPPIVSDLFPFLLDRGVSVVFNEIPRQFTLPAFREDLVNQYAAYTYPYDIFFRIEDIQREAKRRKLKGIIHYVQSFCFRQIQDRILREQLNLPILTLECNRPGPMDAQTRTRLEAFLEMVCGLR